MIGDRDPCFETSPEGGLPCGPGRSRLSRDREGCPAGRRKPFSVPVTFSILKNNLVVTEILDAARRSAATGRTVRLT